MAQVRKYSTGGETSPKLLKREGYGDYNVADIESQYAKNLNSILDEMGLEGEDRQRTIETTKNILSNITNGTINTINSSGQWIVPKEYSSTGYNTYKNAGLFGIKGKKVVRDQNYYNNAAYYILDKVINGTNIYSPKKEDTKEKVNPDQSFEQYLSKYYFNNDKATFDKKLWDYSTARQGIIDRLKEYRDYISKSDMTDAAKTDYLSRIDSGITGLTDNINTNDYSSLARLGWTKPHMWLDENFDTPPETAEQKAVREAKEKIEAEAQAKQQALANQAAVTVTTGSRYRPDLQSHYDRESNSTYYGSINDGIFYPESRVTDELNENGDRVQKTYKYTSPFIPSAFSDNRPIPFVEWENVNDENIGKLLGITSYSGDTETDNSAARVNYYLRLAKMLGESSSTTDSQRSAIEKIIKWINSLKEKEDAEKMASHYATAHRKKGGILLAANGATLTQKNDALLKDLLNNYKTQEAADTKTENQSGYINSDKPHTEFSNADYVRIGALAGDVASLIASMTGVGSVASAGLGVASTAANQTADMMEGMSFLESLARNGGSYALDALSLIPFAKAAKVPKMIKNLGKIAPIITTVISGADAVANGGEYLKSWNKVTNGESLSVNDWRNILNSLQLVTGGLAATHRASKGKSNVESVKSADEVWLKTDQGYRRVNNDLVSKLREAPDLKTQNELLKDTGIKLTESTNWAGKGIGKNKIKTQDLYDFNKQAVTYSGDLELHHNFGPGEKWLGTAQIDFSSYPKVQAAINKVTQIPKYTRKGYNRVFHPQATKRASMAQSERVGGIIEKYRQGNIIKYKSPAQPITKNSGVAYKEGTSWYKDVYLKMRDAMSSALEKGEIDVKALNDLQIAHSALWNTASMGGRDFYTNPYVNTTVGDYQTKFNNLSFGNNIGIKSAYDAGRYNIASSNPTSGDNPTKKWTIDNKFSGITDDRRVLGRKGDFNPTEELEEKAFWKNKGFDFYLDGDGYYKLSPIKRDLTTAQTPSSTQSTIGTTPTASVTNQNTDTGAGAYDVDQESKVKSPYFDNLLAAGRLAGTLYTNNKVAKTVSDSLHPLLLDPLRIRRQVTGDLPTRTIYENQAAESNRIGARPITSDANLQLAKQLEYNDRALKLKTQGYLADKQAIDRTALAAQQANEQNQASAVDVANKNRAAMLGIQQAKANIEASRRSANWQQAWNPFLSSMEQKYINYSKQLDALNRDAANTVELRKLDAASKQAQNTLDLARTNWLKTNTGKSEYDWLNSDEYKNALNDYTEKVTNAGNIYKDTMNKYDLNNLRKPYSFLMFKSGGSTKDIAIENMKELNKTFRKNEELFHKIIMDSKKENNKLIMNLSSLTKELIIKSMTI